MFSNQNKKMRNKEQKQTWETHKYVELNNTLPNNKWIKEEITRETIKNFKK